MNAAAVYADDVEIPRMPNALVRQSMKFLVIGTVVCAAVSLAFSFLQTFGPHASVVFGWPTAAVFATSLLAGAFAHACIVRHTLTMFAVPASSRASLLRAAGGVPAAEALARVHMAKTRLSEWDFTLAMNEVAQVAKATSSDQSVSSPHPRF